MRRPPNKLRERGERVHLDELAAVYADADALFSGHSCPASTECCRFGVTGREPYVTSVELAAVARAVAAMGGPAALRKRLRVAPPSPRSLPLEVRDERRCAFLSDAGRCVIYAARPLGCRTFFCERATVDEPVRADRVRELVRRVQTIAARHEVDGDRGRPLTRALPELDLEGR
jgi:Fe-S-cluster containining protein